MTERLLALALWPPYAACVLATIPWRIAGRLLEDA